MITPLFLTLFVYAHGEPSVKFLYIVPTDRSPYEDVDAVMGELAKHLRDFFHHHLRQWLRYDAVIWEQIDSSTSEQEILNGSALETTGAQTFTAANIYQYIRETIQRRYDFEYHRQKTLFIGILDNDVGGFIGRDGIASVGSPAIDLYLKAKPYYSNSGSSVRGKLAILFHEVGHALGLAHERSTALCMESESQQTFMSQLASIGLEFPPMSAAEKQILLDPNYQQCLLNVGRAHSSEYFTNHCLFRLPKGDAIEKLAAVIANWGECLKYPCNDFNCDSVVDINDLGYILVNWKTWQPREIP